MTPSRIHAGIILERILKAKAKPSVLIVGPNHIHKDVSPLFFSAQLQNIPQGKLVLLDVQGKSGEVKGSFGGLYENIQAFRNLIRRGFPLLFPVSIAQDIRNYQGPGHDLVFDHFAHPFIGGVAAIATRSKKAMSSAMDEALHAYVKAARPGGLVAIMTDTHYLKAISAWAEQNRLRTSLHLVEDKYHVWLPENLIQSVRAVLPEERVHEIKTRPFRGRYRVVLKPEYECPYLLLLRVPGPREGRRARKARLENARRSGPIRG